MQTLKQLSSEYIPSLQLFIWRGASASMLSTGEGTNGGQMYIVIGVA